MNILLIFSIVCSPFFPNISGTIMLHSSNMNRNILYVHIVMYMPCTGEICEKPGYYEFVSYVGTTPQPAPTADEREIPMHKGDPFPPVKSTEASACWEWARPL